MLQTLKWVKEKRYIVLLLLLVMVFVMIFLSQIIVKSEEKNIPVLAPQVLQVKLETVYLDGLKKEEYIDETILSMEDFWAYYEDWDLIEQSLEEMVFRKTINELSPVVQIHGYFGMSEDGKIHIYDGLPEDEQIIQSFFQIDTRKLKGKLKEELAQGIKVEDKSQFNKMVKEFRNLQPS
ncbi:BofC C-terminal domain-containing protein [Alkalihalobacillus trypoxylicola]|uniref:Bypass-of-forespore protein C n=1 Tax=Alkalihalobacillus trypoxylicola TaxID=519424 RepID=A0A162E6C4_9BACI|nr:BofC C-terminal domain-containing protein [Alkalihalobacillus trypoxylicola]KYG31861.1 hypothetical protein AZF04_03530 [Alkalihalobacillus trypoxylicola]